MSAGGSKSASRPEKAHFTVKGHNFLVHKRYVLGKALGAGAYGVVCSVKDNSAGSGEDNKYAMKKIGRLFDDLTDAKRILREIRLIKSMDHPNVLKIVDIDEPENYAKFNEIYLVFELMDTDLSKLIRSRHKLQESQLRYFAYQMLRGLKYIHSANILHRDLKPANIVVRENCDLKICDFGLARYVDPETESGTAMTEYVVTRWYRAPELLLSTGQYSSAMDMWSVGVILAELYLRDVLIRGNDVKHQVVQTCRVIGKPTAEEIAAIPGRSARDFVRELPATPRRDLMGVEGMSLEANDLISRLLQFDPDKRLTAEQALEHPYVVQYRDKASETVSNASLEHMDLEPPSERRLGADGVRRLMWDEMLQYHPDARGREPASAKAASRKIEELKKKLETEKAQRDKMELS